MAVEGEGEPQVPVEEDDDQPDPLELRLAGLVSAEAGGAGGEVREGLAALLADERLDEIAVKVKEKALYKLARLYAEARMFDEVQALLQTNQLLLNAVPKAKTAKMVRTVVDVLGGVEGSMDVQVALCHEVVAWCKREKRTFLRQRIESKLSALLLRQGNLLEAQLLISRLLRDLKKLDDKQMLVEGHLTEARIHHALANIAKSKAALTAARTAANAVYVTPLTQAELDEMSGVLHCEEEDYNTAHSYFLEAFEAFDRANDTRAVTCLTYMMLCKVLQGAADEVPAIMAGKWGLKYTGERVTAMAAVAAAARKRSLSEFEDSTREHAGLLQADTLIRHHLDLLYDAMLESNLLKIVEPFSCVEISRVAELISLPVDRVERKLSQMILDGTFSGILDQGRGHLVVHEPQADDSAFTHGAEVIENVGKVVDALIARARNIGRPTPPAGGGAAAAAAAAEKKGPKPAPGDDKDAGAEQPAMEEEGAPGAGETKGSE
eukprot:CAMPEP_0198423428 /NCGR_PEP_ID=MMETSP1452-20131203/3110_1 /TAXON_ID=1181717 /ORGANISM="Synchroma pusillum, Strain CCMP3072" /LENGTH=492 /DNA_ID=CAMNT_0044143731 /DNA_START=3 /DNA_END=1481 /DNA_ORIENTATION=+